MTNPLAGSNAELREAIARDAESEANACRHAQENAKNDTDKLYRMGQKDALLLFAGRIRDPRCIDVPTHPDTSGDKMREIAKLIDRSRWLAAGQDDPHSVTIDELCDALQLFCTPQTEIAD